MKKYQRRSFHYETTNKFYSGFQNTLQIISAFNKVFNEKLLNYLEINIEYYSELILSAGIINAMRKLI